MSCTQIITINDDAKHNLPRQHVQCPARLAYTLPPANYGCVKDRLVYRSAFPQPCNVNFLKARGLKTILCLVDTENSQECTDYISGRGIARMRIDIAANKEGNVKTTMESIYEALLVAMDANNYPLLIHCNQGRHRTGCVVACLRKMQNWAMPDVIEEYEAYANPKSRDGDHKLITSFEPEAMLEYVKNNVQFDHRPSLMRLLRSDLVNVRTLVNILASLDGVSQSHMSLKSNTSSKADSGIELGMIVEEEAQDLPVRPAETVEVSVEECGPLSPPVESAITQII